MVVKHAASFEKNIRKMYRCNIIFCFYVMSNRLNGDADASRAWTDWQYHYLPPPTQTAGSVLNYFEPFLGRIEIMGSSKCIERVYFEIKENIDQWEKPQIKESKRGFFYAIVTEGDKEKLEAFVNFCEDAIFEMQHAAALMEEEEDALAKKNSEDALKYLSEDEEEKWVLYYVQYWLPTLDHKVKQANAHGCGIFFSV